MPEKVKRGLGLVVVAAIALLVFYPARDATSAGAQSIAGLAGAVASICLIVGLAMIAWGLLRD